MPREAMENPRRMEQKILMILSVLCTTLTLIHAVCFIIKNELEIITDGLVVPQKCLDPYDKSEHALGTSWNSSLCVRCKCNGATVSCCTRYSSSISTPPGCEATLDEQLCEYKIHRINDPEDPCEV
ncbi:small serum protein 2 [Alligator mississippiensis]|uniref:small serum protein 2 n=1 Tax=Alligator mississippiensis TaxID=8496 RepID=UPI002878037B|nr:small serum protein 2 [Alligator mississippiensis]